MELDYLNAGLMAGSRGDAPIVQRISTSTADARFTERVYSTFSVRVMERDAFCALPVMSNV